MAHALTSPTLLDMTPMHPMPTSTVFVALTFGAAWVAWFVVMIAAKIAARTRIVAEPSATDPETVELGKVRDDESLSSNDEEDSGGREAPVASTMIVAKAVASASKPPPPPSAHGAVMVQPLEATLPSIEAMLSDWAQLGVIFLYCWLNEYLPLFPRAGKTPNLDHFWFVTLIFLGVAASTFTKCKDDSLLNRLQTEEWKGWMQFMFLAYHYYHQNETYNAVRVFISCYVWMTGFGNFSFFYLKRDFSGVRMWQMLWRLNFTVFWLCMLMGNTYILYYINPLHTFYFLVVFTTMYIGSSYNHRLWPMRFKMLLLGAIIFVVWEFDGVFLSIFGLILPSTPMIGAKHGALHEWHFRTALDHWDTYFGMLFALNFPSMVKWLRAIEDRAATPRWKELAIKGAIGAVCVAATAVWATTIFPMNKLAYNHHHPYFFLVPLLSYIFLRNCSKWARGYNAEMLIKMGKVTLETYLLQHHAWLSSNAKTIVVLVPGWPLVNTLVCTFVYIMLSQKLFRLTISLRARLIPNAPRDALRYGLGLFAVLAFFGVAAIGIAWTHRADSWHLIPTAIALGLCVALIGGHAVVRAIARARAAGSAAKERHSGLCALLRSRVVLIGLVTALLSVAAALGFVLQPDKLAVVDNWAGGLEHLKPLPPTADSLGDIALALWVVVAAGLVLVLGDNLLGLSRLASLLVSSKYPTAAESYDALNKSIEAKTTPKYIHHCLGLRGLCGANSAS